MIMTDLLTCRIISPDSTLFSGQIRDLTMCDRSGQLQVLPQHAEMFAVLRAGDVILRAPDGSLTSIAVSGGVLHVKDDVATVAV